ncbi:unnamed protein product [Rotaria sp. Silwood2]|nr:unnamed protein product [Rotaria sp. Silwood2]CAF4011225.1 unnamed protein product [Rotaria sp. Silwood2]
MFTLVFHEFDTKSSVWHIYLSRNFAQSKPQLNQTGQQELEVQLFELQLLIHESNNNELAAKEAQINALPNEFYEIKAKTESITSQFKNRTCQQREQQKQIKSIIIMITATRIQDLLPNAMPRKCGHSPTAKTVLTE